MPQNDRHRTRMVYLEFETNEKFENLPVPESMTIVLITNGKAGFILNGKTVMITAPCIMLLSKYDSLKVIELNNISAKSFSFIPNFINSSLTFERLDENNYTEIEDMHDRNMIELFLKRDEYYNGIIDLPPQTYLRISEWLAIMGTEVYAQSDGMWTCRIRRYLLQTLYLLDDIYMNRKNIIKQEKSPIDIALEYLYINYQNDITLDLLCDLVHLNRTSLNRKFKAQTGRTVMDYLLMYRLKISCEALTHTNLNLSEIAQASGFRYDTYFIRQFNKKIGVSPTEYRQNAWNKE
ncbi:MAG: AraC family transcriptional regulator [Oscillospiraceae bacterium]|nr:AraC family transcriptional regulator [Oscillospiraceae bacterium]